MYAAAHTQHAATDDGGGPSAVAVPVAVKDEAAVPALSGPAVDGCIGGGGRRDSFGRTTGDAPAVAAASSSHDLQAAAPVLHSFRSDSGQSAETAAAVLAAARLPRRDAPAVVVRCSAMVAAPSNGKRQLDTTTSSFRGTHDCKRVKA